MISEQELIKNFCYWYGSKSTVFLAEIIHSWSELCPDIHRQAIDDINNKNFDTYAVLSFFGNIVLLKTAMISNPDEELKLRCGKFKTKLLDLAMDIHNRKLGHFVCHLIVSV